MALTLSNELAVTLSQPLRRQLLDVAGESIRQGLGNETLNIHAGDYPEPLRVTRATFVTLHIDERLRGCIGTLDARQALVQDVAHNAYNAAFEDPRFPALSRHEFARITIHISVLSPPAPMQFRSEADLLSQIRPGIDGLIIEAGFARGTFLPAVWESLPEPQAFLRHLKQKAGLPADYWSSLIRVKRYTAESIP